MITDEILARNANLYKVILPLETILSKMSYMGIPIHKGILEYKSVEYKNRIRECEDRVFELAGKQFNLNSYVQVRDVLYGDDNLNLPPVMKKGKVQSDKYALALLNYEHKEHQELLFNWRLSKLVRHRLNNFVDKFMVFEPCDACSNKPKNRPSCRECVGTGRGVPIDINDHYVTKRDGWHWTHPSFLQLAITGRINSLNPNFLNIPRNDYTWDIWVRNMIAPPPGFNFNFTDREKAERKIAAIIFKDEVMLDEVNRGAAAISDFASEALGIDPAQAGKGSLWYNVMKTFLYASQYLAGPDTIHATLMKQDIYYPVEKCEEIVKQIEDKYKAYYENVFKMTWAAIHRGYIRNWQGRIIRLDKPFQLDGFKTWEHIVHGKARGPKQVFLDMARLVSSFSVQGTATGDGLQVAALRFTDELDKMMKPEWSYARTYNGDWERARPMLFIHDEVVSLQENGLEQDVIQIAEDVLRNGSVLAPYLEENPLLGTLDMDFNVESSMGLTQWSTKVPDDPENDEEDWRYEDGRWLLYK